MFDTKLPYHEYLSDNYFDGIYQKVSRNLINAENICISVIPGCGARTLFNYLLFHIKKNKLYHNICIYNPEFEKSDLIEYINNEVIEVDSTPLIVIIPSFELIKNKSEILLKMDAMRRKFSRKIVYLVITDQSVITDSHSYTTGKSILFSELIYVPPFNLRQTKMMINSLTTYYGWHVPSEMIPTIYKLSGGVPRLIKYLCKEHSESKINLKKLDKICINHQIEFQLNNLAHILIVTPEKYLDCLGITKNNKIKSLLLKKYFKQYISDKVLEMFPTIHASDGKILTYLIENKNKVLSIDKIADIMKLSEEEFSLWLIYKRISRLKEKVKRVYRIRNIKGAGYLLENINQ